MRIGFAASDWGTGDHGEAVPGGTAWYRCILPARWIADNTEHETFVGQDVAAHNRTGEIMLVERTHHDTSHPLNRTRWHHDLDVVVITRWMQADAARVIRRARACGQVVVNDLDDWYHGMAPWNLAWWTSHPRYDAERNRNHYMEALRASTAVTVSTPYIAERYRDKVRRPMILVRNAIDLDHRWPYPHPRSLSRPRLGWVGHTAFRHADVEQLAGVAGQFCRRHGWGFHHAGHVPGAPHAADLAKVDRDRVPVTESGLVPIDEYPSLFRDFEVGVVPLSGHPFNEAKSCIKGMEYAAAGVPFVAQASGEYRWLAEQGVGRAVRRPREWLRALDELVDPAARELEADRNRARLAKLSMSARWPAWLDAYTELADLVA